MKLKKIAVLLVLAGAAAPVFATNGYFAHGYGMKAKGMGGAATAVTGDTFGGANNPATMVWAGNRMDVGVDLFMPKRSASRQGNPGAAGDGSVESDSNEFLVPEFGYNKMLNSNMSAGVTVYGNGGMNTDFPATGSAGPNNLLLGSGRLGVDLMQLIIAPTLSYKLNANHSVGISPLFGFQRFKVDGLSAFTPLSSSSGDVTNKGDDDSTGWGVRIGWFGKLSDTVSLGAAYSSRMRMSAFDQYKGLFAEGGDFDIPENYNFGIAVKATPSTTVAFDIQQINYADVKSIANPVANSLRGLGATYALGTANGSGFAWRDMTVFKLGVEHEYSKNLVVRAGYNYGKSPVRGGTIDDVTFNIIAPAVVEHHLTLGATLTLADKSELTVSYMHAFSNSVTGPSATSLLGQGGNETLKMKQDSIGIAYGIKY
ncbi:MAG: outer membrane protein transport protein [Candidatus Nitricoxidivorans perseverans]|uniref:Outer membrane protein transport protein n=1 Tax=Candidatus Nitricoxidivorans perseverans TaxID=2975601 RepID=A0AA49FL46_9PROT|nr:MAG: outer membrane protein transport protein [Candidatus Nitricoxidivorans perseverans]